MILDYFLQSTSTVYRLPSNCTASLKACSNFDEVGLSSTLSSICRLIPIPKISSLSFIHRSLLPLRTFGGLWVRDLLSHMIQSTVKFTCNAVDSSFFMTLPSTKP
ncbi:hypothetical protein T02_13024 [Trichinella nativa]|uniref:Uncharacterized protein n=1 Tax=Trichinella nativa TaxID=6335 RepID=A0A0V1LJT7_9BILA|nr:hypothetical protein T02_13024 [Trichinella nativa]